MTFRQKGSGSGTYELLFHMRDAMSCLCGNYGDDFTQSFDQVKEYNKQVNPLGAQSAQVLFVHHGAGQAIDNEREGCVTPDSFALKSRCQSCHAS